MRPFYSCPNNRWFTVSNVQFSLTSTTRCRNQLDFFVFLFFFRWERANVIVDHHAQVLGGFSALVVLGRKEKKKKHSFFFSSSLFLSFLETFFFSSSALFQPAFTYRRRGHWAYFVFSVGYAPMVERKFSVVAFVPVRHACFFLCCCLHVLSFSILSLKKQKIPKIIIFNLDRFKPFFFISTGFQCFRKTYTTLDQFIFR